jgi:uncharacterized protein (UPF0332 family)
VPSKKKEIEEAVRKAEHNRKFARFLDSAGSPFPDWVIVGAFYSAVHFVEAFLLSRGLEHSTSHSNRTRNLFNEDHGHEFGRLYNRLKQHGFNARYTYSFDVDKAYPEVLPALEKIRSGVLNHLGNVVSEP